MVRTKNTILLFIVGSILAISMLAQSGIVRAEGEQQETTQATPVTTQAEPAPKEAFHFVAQKGDSYSKMARKATQIYGIEKQVELSGAQIVFVETNLTKEAGSPLLNLGQEVHIEKDTVGVWVDKAKNLSETEKARWQKYADRVDFNTNNVGEVR